MSRGLSPTAIVPISAIRVLVAVSIAETVSFQLSVIKSSPQFTTYTLLLAESNVMSRGLY